MPDAPLVSVVLPTYNRAHSLLASVGSVLRQSHKQLELIIVDDASEDGTTDLVATVDDPRVRYERFASNRGANAARNRGIAMARGVYIALQDSDDLWDHDKLEKQLDALSRYDAQVCFCALRDDAAGGVIAAPKRYHRVPQGRCEVREKLLRGSFISNQTLLLHRDCTRRETFDEQLPRLQDWEFCIRLSDSFTFCYIDEPLVSIGSQAARISSSGSESYVAAVDYILQKHRGRFAGARDGAAIARINAALHALRAGHFAIGLRQVGLAITEGRAQVPRALLTMLTRL